MQIDGLKLHKRVFFTSQMEIELSIQNKENNVHINSATTINSFTCMKVLYTCSLPPFEFGKGGDSYSEKLNR